MTSFNLDPASDPRSAGGPAPVTPGGAPKLHIDSDWKAQAQAEKERLAKQEQERSSTRKGDGRRGPDDLPPADFRSLVGILASQVLSGLGAYGDSKSGRVIVDLAGARFGIDLLGVLEEKTKGNLSEEEAGELREVLAELRSRYVHFHDLVARQQAAAAAGASATGPMSPMGEPGGRGQPMPPPTSGPKLHMP